MSEELLPNHGQELIASEGFKLDSMDFVRGAIATAMAENMTPDELWECAEHAAEVEDFCDAVNVEVYMMKAMAQMQVGDNG